MHITWHLEIAADCCGKGNFPLQGDHQTVTWGLSGCYMGIISLIQGVHLTGTGKGLVDTCMGTVSQDVDFSLRTFSDCARQQGNIWF